MEIPLQSTDQQQIAKKTFKICHDLDFRQFRAYKMHNILFVILKKLLLKMNKVMKHPYPRDR